MRIADSRRIIGQSLVAAGPAGRGGCSHHPYCQPAPTGQCTLQPCPHCPPTHLEGQEVAEADDVTELAAGDELAPLWRVVHVIKPLRQRLTALHIATCTIMGHSSEAGAGAVVKTGRQTASGLWCLAAPVLRMLLHRRGCQLATRRCTAGPTWHAVRPLASVVVGYGPGGGRRHPCSTEKGGGDGVKPGGLGVSVVPFTTPVV